MCGWDSVYVKFLGGPYNNILIFRRHRSLPTTTNKLTHYKGSSMYSISVRDEAPQPKQGYENSTVLGEEECDSQEETAPA